MKTLQDLKAGDEIAYRDDWGTLSIKTVHKVSKLYIYLLNYEGTFAHKYSKKTGCRIDDKWAGDSVHFLTDNLRRAIELRKLRDEVCFLLNKVKDGIKNMDKDKCINIIEFLKGHLNNEVINER